MTNPTLTLEEKVILKMHDLERHEEKIDMDDFCKYLGCEQSELNLAIINLKKENLLSRNFDLIVQNTKKIRYKKGCSLTPEGIRKAEEIEERLVK